MSGIGHPDTWSVGERDTVIAALDRAVARHPDRILLDFSGNLYTYSEVDSLSTRMAHALAALGVKPGETVLTMLDNNIDAVVCWLAINKLRAVSVPINTALKGEFLRHQIADTGTQLVICEADYLPRILPLAEQLSEVSQILYRGERAEPASCRIPIAALDEFRGEDDTPFTSKPQPSDLACLIYTSGTTGPSKGCMISYNFMCNLARLQLRAGPANENDVTITPLPLFHMNALCVSIIASILVGARAAILPRFSVSNFWQEVERSGATIASILGGMGGLLAQAPDNDAMKRCHGQIHTARGNPYTEETKQIWRERFGTKLVGGNGYGLTEACVITSLAAGEYAAPGSSGKRIPDFDVRIVDDNDQELPANTPGEIVLRPLRPDIMFQGYWNRPADTLKLMRNMWFHTGDIGKFDDDGFFYFVDRKKDYLRRRGENISSFEMEAAFAVHPDLAEVAVHAVPSDKGEDDVKVTAVLHQGARLTPEELFHWATDSVPYYALPRYIEFRDSLPKNPQGRVLKYQLRDEGKTADTWDLEDTDIKVAKK
ncbi:TPA: ATP-dependent acyl-CoA ligase [Pseudomonas aeruginosa]|jgi:carnitine-CoA ligase|uniref:ATP-dependent acyl-CoA ligase n=4 Tax=Pseudomonadaceae TaxID=135621 RepID=A0A427HVM8_ECTOL|nr:MULTISPECIES: AMP-binding protein [Pseudomonas]AAK95584.1 coenzyme A ligase [Pseudomonas diterpeniphila]OZB34865.1 MAG: ATP-dependent acyl-CoA ligase [Pseudomonas sp. 34-62-33]KSL70763.1 ATP-dependent acyl-CoA ligase [Pseudomonas aeruginosa]KSM83948.1 ATP-dependent acyl-CoA ligase [Pseudomonas aeruginosa]MBG6882754.1 ATP-dependent acyl-CoA ligase [Pseudomonas aeruginosa]